MNADCVMECNQSQLKRLFFFFNISHILYSCIQHSLGFTQKRIIFIIQKQYISFTSTNFHEGAHTRLGDDGID